MKSKTVKKKKAKKKMNSFSDEISVGDKYRRVSEIGFGDRFWR